MSTTKSRAAIYARISRDAEGEEFGVTRQIDLCQALAADRKLTVVEDHIYSDNDVGASERTGAKKRENYERMLEDARAGKFDVILTYSITRLTRRVREFEELVTLHLETGVTYGMVDSKSDLDLSTPVGLFMARMMANMATFESDVISQRQIATFEHNAYQGKPKLQRQRPFGWKADGVTLEPEEADRIKDAVAKILQGASLSSIRDEWMAAGVLTAAGNEKWEHSVLKRVLTGWRTAGIRTYQRQPLYKDGELVKGAWERIISPEDRERALAMLAKRARRKVRKHKWLLTGFVRCAECDGKMYGQLTGTPTYSCKAGNGHVAITASALEDHVLAALADRVWRKEQAGTLEDDTPRTWPDEERLKEVLQKIEENRLDWARGEILKEDYNAMRIVLADQRERLRKEREKFYSTTVKPTVSRARRGEMLEWALDFMNHESAPKRGKNPMESESFNAPWGAADHDSLRGLPPAPERDPDSLRSPDLEWELELDAQPAKEVAGVEASVDEDYFAEQREMALRRELKRVFVKKGNRGRAGWGRSAFLERVEIEWMD